MLNNIIAIIAISFLIVGSLWGIGNLLSPQSENKTQKPSNSLLLIAQNNAFNKTNPSIVVKEESPIKLIILNKDFVKHDFISKELGINSAYLTTEQDFVTAIAAENPGNYEYYCSFHPTMKGKIIVV
ncbi:MAG: cupredoxin domain-containing protein [Thermoproteota archaeon]|nr:cupredoxin domain-containing protein [Thermoproteota archaeon]